VGVDYVYRNYDQGTASYVIGFQPGAAGFPLSAIYTGPSFYTDPETGITAPYYTVCETCSRPSGVGNITITDVDSRSYHGVIFTANKRFSDRWQLNGSLTLQDNPSYFGFGSNSFVNPTGREFQHGVSTIAPYLLTINGSYAAPWGITTSANLNINPGGTRTRTINGPGTVSGSGGLNSSGALTSLTYNTLEYQARDSERYDKTALLDAGLHKTFNFSGGKYRVKVMGDVFNIFNIATITSYSSGNLSLATSNQVSRIIPPRVFRLGAQIFF
jgi:hypothetical protein